MYLGLRFHLSIIRDASNSMSSGNPFLFNFSTCTKKHVILKTPVFKAIQYVDQTFNCFFNSTENHFNLLKMSNKEHVI